MKKLFLLSVFAVFTISSFAVNSSTFIKKPTLKAWNYWCADGRTGTFYTNASATLADAQVVTHMICN